MTNEIILKNIKFYINTQKKLVEQFVKNHHFVKDWKFFSDVPKSGELFCDGEIWFFLKHGLGINFKNIDGITIDAHKYFRLHPDAVDIYRFAEFLNSKNKNIFWGEIAVEKIFNNLIKENYIYKLGDDSELFKINQAKI